MQSHLNMRMQDLGGKRILRKVLFSFKHQCPEGTIFFIHSRPIHCKYLHFLKSLVPVTHESHIFFQVPFTAKVAARRDDSLINQIPTARPHIANLGISLALSPQSFDRPPHCLSLTSLVVSFSPFQASLKSHASFCGKIFFPLWKTCIPSGVSRSSQGKTPQKRSEKMLYQYIWPFSEFFLFFQSQQKNSH